MNDQFAGRFECEVEEVRSGETCVVTVRGEVDLASAADLEAGLRRALAGGPSSLMIDFEALTFIDSSGLRVLVSVAKDARARDVVIGLRNVPHHAQRVLDITGLADWFEVETDT